MPLRSRNPLFRALRYLLIGAVLTVATSWLLMAPIPGAFHQREHFIFVHEGYQWSVFEDRDLFRANDYWNRRYRLRDGETPQDVTERTKQLYQRRTDITFHTPDPLHPGFVRFASEPGVAEDEMKTARDQGLPPPNGATTKRLQRFGFPALSLYWGVEEGAPRGRMFGAFLLPFMGILLAYFPLWPGFLINTIFYAAVAWSASFALTSFRTRRRRRCGLCPRCAYDLAHNTTSGCPECGWNRAPGSAAAATMHP